MYVVPVLYMLENEKPEELAALLDVARDMTWSGTATVNVLKKIWLPNIEVLPFYASSSHNSMLNLCYFMISVLMSNQ